MDARKIALLILLPGCFMTHEPERNCEWDREAFLTPEDLEHPSRFTDVYNEGPECFSLFDQYMERSIELGCCVPFGCVYIPSETNQDRKRRFNRANDCSELEQAIWHPNSF